MYITITSIIKILAFTVSSVLLFIGGLPVDFVTCKLHVYWVLTALTLLFETLELQPNMHFVYVASQSSRS